MAAQSDPCVGELTVDVVVSLLIPPSLLLHIAGFGRCGPYQTSGVNRIAAALKFHASCTKKPRYGRPHFSSR
jgi:hypothetical protein